jgi:hypothetical protein
MRSLKDIFKSLFGREQTTSAWNDPEWATEEELAERLNKLYGNPAEKK